MVVIERKVDTCLHVVDTVHNILQSEDQRDGDKGEKVWKEKHRGNDTVQLSNERHVWWIQFTCCSLRNKKED